MKKLTLRLDSLKVESFETGQETGPGRGTVRANWIPTLEHICPGTLLRTNPTCCPCTP